MRSKYDQASVGSLAVNHGKYILNGPLITDYSTYIDNGLHQMRQ
jgi:hypothetical protein